MVHRRADEGNAQGGGGALVKVVDFHSDVALVVVEGKHHVELAAYGPIEHRIRRDGADGVQALPAGVGDGGSELVDFLAPKQPPFPAVGVERRHGDARTAQAPPLKRFVDEAQFIAHIVAGGIPGGFNQGLVGGQMHDLEARRHQHRCGRCRARQPRQDFLVADVAHVARCVNGLLVDGACDHRGQPTFKAERCRRLHRLHRMASAGNLNFAMPKVRWPGNPNIKDADNAGGIG